MPHAGPTTPPTRDAEPTTSEIRRQLGKILASPRFARAEQLRRFLTYAVEQKLADAAGELKEYVIGVEVFSRGENFDPGIDPIVRVQARALRLRLDEYYTTEGKADEVIVAFRKRSYAPVFARRHPVLEPSQAAQPDAPAPNPKRWRRIMPLAAAGLAVLSIVALLFYIPRNRTGTQPLAGSLTQVTFDSGLSTDPALSPDGWLLAYASDRAGVSNLDIWIQHANSTEARRITSGAGNEREPCFSPDSATLAYSSDGEFGGVQLASVNDGRSAIRLATSGREPRFSPDGRWITYWTGERHVYGVRGRKQFIIPVGGGEPREVTALCSSSFGNWLADSRHLLVYGFPCDSRDPAWYVVAAGVSGAVPVEHPRRIPLAGQLQMPFGSAEGHANVFGNRMVFAARSGRAANLWRVDLSERAPVRPERLTFGTGTELSPSSANGSVAFVDAGFDSHIWSLAAETNQGAAAGEPARIVSGTAPDWAPSIRRGPIMVFLSSRHGTPAVWVRDRRNGTERVLPDSEGAMSPKLSPDGHLIAFRALVRGESETRVVDITTGRVLATRKEPGSPVDWSANGREVLIDARAGNHQSLQLWDFRHGRSSDVLQAPESGSVENGAFSPDFRWMAFYSRTASQRTVYIAPFRGMSLVPRSEWITVSQPGSSDSCPKWSPGGRLLYYLSDSDGSRCIWARHLDSQKRPVGDSFPIRHFHDPRRSLSNLENPGAAGFSVAEHELIFALGERKGNVWILQLSGRL